MLGSMFTSMLIGILAGLVVSGFLISRHSGEGIPYYVFPALVVLSLITVVYILKQLRRVS